MLLAKPALGLLSSQPHVIVRCFATTSSLDQNYYEALGVPRSATQKEIRAAYIKKSRQFHPDSKKSDSGTEEFVRVSEAYEILGKPFERKQYDLQLSNELARETQRKYHNNSTNYSDLSQMSVDERLKAMGYHQDQNFFKGNNDRYWIALACGVIAVAGFFIHYQIAKLGYEKHAKKLNEITTNSNNHLNEAMANAQTVIPGYEGNSSVRRFIMRTDKSGENLKEYEELVRKRLERKRQKEEAAAAKLLEESSNDNE